MTVKNPLFTTIEKSGILPAILANNTLDNLRARRLLFEGKF